ncbi:glycosyltransferase family 2 protein [Reichenbachiella versicolor]|uniref:glycosyltransferase family 2 protein n=1 Tax=Reichenbachiella versicolor TaxID=1821036 RepID=UPI000D6E8D57|nr:glycosyltransferase [Reichenbachiella versicolor]
MKFDLTIVFGYRNRELQRVRRCLESLSKQSVKNFKVVFIDYGSDSVIAKEVESLISSYSFCDYHYNDTRGWVWNRSHALNTGIRLADTEFIMTTDVDLIYSEKFVETVIANLSKDKELHSNSYALPKRFREWDNLNKVQKNLSARNLTALGLAQGVSTDLHYEINGFDEHYCIWGVEDYDLNRRLEKKGVQTKWLDLDSCPVYHQWHPKSGVRNSQTMPLGWQRYMQAYCDRMNGLEKRNDDEWGSMHTKALRPLFNISKEVKVETVSKIPHQAVSDLLGGFMASSATSLKKFFFSDRNYIQGKSSNVLKIISVFNSLSNRFDLPVLLTNDASYFGLYSSHLEYYSMIMYWLSSEKKSILDYYLDVKEEGIELTLLK